jgi:1-aminocyclopropane-1-carboxylate synthase
MFVWLDLRAHLGPAAEWEAERRLWRRLHDRCRVLLTPGEDCHAREPGFFRLCFAWMPPEALGVCVARMAAELAA